MDDPVSTACLGQAHRAGCKAGERWQGEGLAYDSRASME